ncbi:lipopolysaccharide biosynthesis protein [Luteimonas fraxinea]|uniref:lipopolysaccharide biosynthesis protein n=1 Tax=Luteimonas fraxinea TaxID=2901869 RepID=UPI001E303747|nr:lipopolysaccharide biosynthesis protein [Luteimonas fraxinea]MCD9124382.1 lipopolysaccharide biosynthesis protein [Luteimonas fraxinea]
MELRRRALFAMAWSAAEILLRFGSQLVVMAILARLLGPSDVGLMAMAMAFVALAVLAVDGGLGAALIQKTSIDDSDLDSVFWCALASGVCLGGIAWCVAPHIADFFEAPKVESLVRTLAMVLPVTGLAVVPDALLSRALRFSEKTKAEALASVGSGVVAVALALSGHGVDSLAWQVVLAALIRTAFLLGRVRWLPGIAIDVRRISRLARFGGFYMAASMLDAVATRLQSLLIGRLFTPALLGYYTIAQSTQQAPASVLVGVVNRVGLPVLSSVSASKDELRSGMRTGLRLSVLVFTPGMFLLALLSEPILGILFGPSWVSAANIMSLLAIGTALWPIHVLNAVAVQSLGGSRAMFVIEIAKQCLTIASIAVGVFWGPAGVAMGLLLANILCIPLSTFCSGKYLEFGLRKQSSEIGATLLTCVVTFAIGKGLMMLLPPGGLWLVAIVVAYWVVYVGLCSMTKNRALDDLWRMVRALRVAGQAKGA